MFNKSWNLILTLLCMTICIGIIYLLIHPESLDIIFSKPLYGISILFFFVSFVLVMIIVDKSAFFSPSLFLLILFVAVPLFGVDNFRQSFESNSDIIGSGMPSFDFPIFVWSVGTICFFVGVFLSWLLFPELKHNYVVFWNNKRMKIFLKISFLLFVSGTIIAIYKIGYIPLLRSGDTSMRLIEGGKIGSLASRFLSQWQVAHILSSMLFFLEKGKRRYIYLFITITCAIGTFLFAYRTGVVLIFFFFGLMYIKYSKIRIPHFILLTTVTLLLAYGLMIQAEHRGGYYSSTRTVEERVTAHAFPEWQFFSIVVDEAQSKSNFKGWQIVVGPFIALIPGPVYTLLGYDKFTLIKQYSAVFYYGRKFDEPDGIRIGPIGEAFAAYGFAGVIFQMMVLGIFFGAFEKIYSGLGKHDARLCVTCYFLILMLFLPISTMLGLFTPLLDSGIFIFVFYILGTKKIIFPVEPSVDINGRRELINRLI